jgi:hypothetical protein
MRALFESVHQLYTNWINATKVYVTIPLQTALGLHAFYSNPFLFPYWTG